MSQPSRTPSTAELVTALVRSPELHEIAATVVPVETGGRPREIPAWSAILLGVLGRHFRSAARAEVELHSTLLWRHVEDETARLRECGHPVEPAPRPPTWMAWRNTRDRYLATEEGLAAITEIHLRHAAALADLLHLARHGGPGSWSHPDKTRAVFGDGTLVRGMYRPPVAVREPQPDGSVRIRYPDRATGELHDHPVIRYDPDTAEHHGQAGPVHGINYVAWHLRGPAYYQRVILIVGRVPAPGQEADTAVRLLADVRRTFGDGIQVAVYDGALRGKHIETIMRRDGYLVLSKPTRDSDTAHAPTMLRLPGRRLARSFPLGTWEHQVGARRCLHLLATLDGAPAEIALDEAGDPSLIALLTRRQVKRARTKDGRFRFSVGYEVACPDGPFLVWLSPHTEPGDGTARRPENLRIITATDPDGSRVYGIRSDAEAHHNEYKQTLRNVRAMCLGGARGLLDQYCYALVHNALVQTRAIAEPDTSGRGAGSGARRRVRRT